MTCTRVSGEGIEAIVCSRGRRGKLRTKKLGPSGLPSAELLAAVGAARTQAELFAALPLPLPAEEAPADVVVEVYSAGHWHEWDRLPSIEAAQIHARRLATLRGREGVRITSPLRLTSHLTRIAGLRAAISETAPPRPFGAEQGAGEEADSRQPGGGAPPPGSYSLKKQEKQETNPLSGQPAQDGLHSRSACAGAHSFPPRRYVVVADRWGGCASPVDAENAVSAHQIARERSASTGEPWRVYCLARTDQGVTWSPDGYPYWRKQ